ncbi:DUF2848 domain-containing protein [Pseudarthrobacter sp. NamE5]|uniref:DUF2848 domain-containing protein n=1 Tax=Pseudarthrobacter sp. NamE5 TaxID=2576839 RepID=UPI00110B66BD|nr:DUF2848 domain-containing protein [Pseudarthrobacter sp. NamE5]TLM80956.1 DUF2848 domain-containing protein [Pseudarthrobacter sp. NamE5]
MSTLTLVMPDGTTEDVRVLHLLNAGYAGREQQEVQAHIAELAQLGVAAPSATPALYPVSPYLAQQTDTVHVQHDKTSGEAEWALIITEDDVLLTVACDHTDRALEVHGVAWSKNASPNVLGRQAWKLDHIREHLDSITLRAWVGTGHDEELIQDTTLETLLSPDYWLRVLSDRGLREAGTVLMSGTVAMIHGIDQFGSTWRVELADPVLNRSLELKYNIVVMPAPVG